MEQIKGSAVFSAGEPSSRALRAAVSSLQSETAQEKNFLVHCTQYSVRDNFMAKFRWRSKRRKMYRESFLAIASPEVAPELQTRELGSTLPSAALITIRGHSPCLIASSARGGPV